MQRLKQLNIPDSDAYDNRCIQRQKDGSKLKTAMA